MRTRTSWLALLLSAGVALAPGGARGQDYFPPASAGAVEPMRQMPWPEIRPPTGLLTRKIAEPKLAQPGALVRVMRAHRLSPAIAFQDWGP